MSSESTSAALYAAVSSSSSGYSVPKDVKALNHHNKEGKGFINPWDSYTELSAREIVSILLGLVAPLAYNFATCTDKTRRKLLGNAKRYI